MKPAFRQRLPLLLILLAGTALRLCRLGADSLWYDETVSAYLAGSPLPALLRHTAGDIHPPGYYIILRGWLILMGYPTGRADPQGMGLEFAAGFLSLFLGVLLIALVYVLGNRAAGIGIATVAAGLVAASPFNVWYSQEVRMYTLGAALGSVVLYALLQTTRFPRLETAVLPASTGSSSAGKRRFRRSSRDFESPIIWWAAYALAAIAGMYTLYYFAFLLIPLNLWALSRLARKSTGIVLWLVANAVVLLLYAPWIPIAWRQAIDPPVPPWRVAPAPGLALRETWNALSLGQSAPAWLWPVLLLVLALYIVGLLALTKPQEKPKAAPSAAVSAGDYVKSRSAIRRLLSAVGHPLCLATFGPLALILLVSGLVTPLYHVRYLFTYSMAFYVVLVAGLAWLWKRWRTIALLLGFTWLVAAGITLFHFWNDPAYRADDHRSAVAFLESHWQPGDVALVDAGYAYPALVTYWHGPIASRSRLTEELPVPRADDALVMVTTGHVDGDPGLGWNDPKSDFFAMPSGVAQDQVAELFKRFPRVWHYRIYDTVSDPGGLVRRLLVDTGHETEDQWYPGEAQMRVQGFVPRGGANWAEDRPVASYGAGLIVQPEPLPAEIESGQTIYGALAWRSEAQPPAEVATSLRLIGPEGTIWAQPPDERPLGPLFPSSQWPPGETQHQPLALPVPTGTPPGAYTVELVVYDPSTGQPWPAESRIGPMTMTPDGISLGSVAVVRPASTPSTRPALARFGPLALIDATSPATVISAGDAIPVEFLWQASESPQEPLVIVVQLLDDAGRVMAGLEEEPLQGRYPTQNWAKGELVRDRHLLDVPSVLGPGDYRLVVGVYRATDRERLTARQGLLGTTDYFTIKPITVRR
jgi:uncharacterized membrane protein